MEDLGTIISGHPFFRDMEPRFTDLLVGCATNTRMKTGEFFFREGENADHFYCIRSGHVRLELGTPERGPVVIDSRGPGEILGWSWIVPPYRWYCDARATGDVRALAFNAACLRTRLGEDSEFGYQMYTRFVPLMHRNLENTRLQLMDVYAPR